MTDPLGSGGLSGALTDVTDLLTGSYVPVMITAILFGVVLAIGFRWLRRVTSVAGRGR